MLCENLLKERGCKSIKLCTLFDKPSRREAPVYADYIGYEVANEFIVGYGLDFNERYRNLPYVGVFEAGSLSTLMDRTACFR